SRKAFSISSVGGAAAITPIRTCRAVLFCWPAATTGHAVTPPSKLMNSRRLMCSLRTTLEPYHTARAIVHHSKFRWLMSALGQKQTYAAQYGMSALPPKATSIAFFGISGGHLTFDNERDLKGVHSAVLVSPIRGGANAVHRNYEDHFGGGRSRRSP